MAVPKIKILRGFRYLMYQNPIESHFLLGLPIYQSPTGQSSTLVTPTVPLLTLNLQNPVYYSGADYFFCVNMFNATCNLEEGTITFLPPEQLTHVDAVYMVSSSSLVWDHTSVSCPGVVNLMQYCGPTPSVERSLSIRWLPGSSTFVSKETLQKVFESLGHRIVNIVFKRNGLALIEFSNPYSVPIILVGERELTLVLDNTITVSVSKVGDKIDNRVYVTFENLDVTADKLTSQKLKAFLASLGFAVTVSMEKVAGREAREPRCAFLHFNSAEEARAFLAGQPCRSFYIGNRMIRAKPYVAKTKTGLSLTQEK